MRRKLSIKYQLLIANAFILVLPLLGAVFLHLWDGHLVRITEQRLLAESVLIAELWRTTAGVASAGDAAARGRPVEPVLELDYATQPSSSPPRPGRADDPLDDEQRRAFAALLKRARARDLSAVQILDGKGCLIIGTARGSGCYDALPEVRTALAGSYTAVVRPRSPARSRRRSLRDYGTVAVTTALPIRAGGDVVAVVRMTRASIGPLEVVWKQRWTVLLAALACLVTTAAITHFLSRSISHPLRAITRLAASVARGESPRRFHLESTAAAELHSLVAALDRMTAQLTDRAAYIADFATNMSHELKTPLTGIRGAVELLAEQWHAMPEEQRERFLANIAADAERMRQLVTRLLELARIQSSPDRAEHLEVAPLLRAVAAPYAGRVVFDLERAPAELIMNRDHLETAVRNLLDNAVRHGNDEPVEVAVWSEGGRTRISVRDHGDGISEGNRARVFDRFFTTERDRGGTGLGLAIVRAVAEIRNGSVDFVTGPRGTTFTLTV